MTPQNHFLIPKPRPAKRKIFISYHHELDQFWFNHFTTQFGEKYEVSRDESLDTEVDCNDIEYVNRVIREDYISGSSITMVLCGAEAAKRRFIDWEIHSTLQYEHALLGIRLPASSYYIPLRLLDNVQSGYASVVPWPTSPGELKTQIEAALRKGKLKAYINNDRMKMRRNLP